MSNAPPGDGRARPLDKGGPSEHKTAAKHVDPSIARRSDTFRAAELLADAWQPALERAHRIGWHAGYRRGHQDGKREEHDGWMAVLGACRRTMQRPTHAELVARRLADSKCICDRCSACIRRAQVERNRAQYGADDYPGHLAP